MKETTNRMAVWSLRLAVLTPLCVVLGVLGQWLLPLRFANMNPVLGITLLLILVSPLVALAAVSYGHRALSQIRKSDAPRAGRAQAITGMVCGYGFGSLLVLAGFTLPAFQRPAAMNQQTKALSQARQIVTACRAYAADHDGNFPARLDDLFPDYLPDRRILLCPTEREGVGEGYDYVGGRDDDPADKIVLQSRTAVLRKDGQWRIRIVVHVDQSAEKIKVPR